MYDDPLKPLFDQADIGPSAPKLSPAEISCRVQSVYRQRQRRRRILATTALILACAVDWQSVHRPDEGPSRKPSTDKSQVAAPNADLRSELAQLQERIDREQQIVKSLIADERREKASAMAKDLDSGLNPAARVDEQVGRASLSILLSGDRVRGRKDFQTSAGRDYELVIARFPNTPWADIAKERLASLQP